MFALTSLAEGIPVVLMEAMATGLPVVASDITGIPELVGDGEEGLLVPAGDAGGFAAALETLARDPDRRARMGEHGRRRVEARVRGAPVGGGPARRHARVRRPAGPGRLGSGEAASA